MFRRWETQRNYIKIKPGVPIELVKYGTERLVQLVANIFNKCLLNGGTIPID